jgi:transcriptional regulator with XRE-family HTH domain
LPVSESHVLRLLSERIKSLRNTRRWSQEQLAERASIQRSYLAALERGTRNPSVRTLVKLANALNVSVSDLFDSNFREWALLLSAKRTADFDNLGNPSENFKLSNSGFVPAGRGD